MNKELKIASVKELQSQGLLLVEDGNHGESRPRSDEFEDKGVAFIRAADIDEGRVSFDSASKINETAFRRITKGIGNPGDILLSHKGTVGKLALVEDGAPPFVCSPQVTFWRTLNPEIIDRNYLYAFLRSPSFRTQLETRAGESDMAPYVSLTSQRELLVTLPPIRKQRSLGLIIHSLDSKIIINQQINKTLEEIGKAIFKHWFIDFEFPNEDGHPYKSSGGDMVYSEELGREIPAGWEMKIVNDLVTVRGGSTPSTENPEYWNNGTINWCTPKDLSNNKSTVLLDTERKITQSGLATISSGLLPVGAVLLSSRAPIGYLAICEIPVAINQGFIAIICDKVISKYFMLFWLQRNMDKIESRAHGTTFQEINKANFRDISILVPTQAVLHNFEKLIDPIYRKAVNNERETKILSSAKDSLLPKLMSGRIRVPVEAR